jgi:hypothetical protein
VSDSCAEGICIWTGNHALAYTSEAIRDGMVSGQHGKNAVLEERGRGGKVTRQAE